MNKKGILPQDNRSTSVCIDKHSSIVEYFFQKHEWQENLASKIIFLKGFIYLFMLIFTRGYFSTDF